MSKGLNFEDFGIFPLAAYRDLVRDQTLGSRGGIDGFYFIFEEKSPQKWSHGLEGVGNVFKHHCTPLEPTRSRYGNFRVLESRFLGSLHRFGSTMMKPIVEIHNLNRRDSSG